jgi:hypothetical protein
MNLVRQDQHQKEDTIMKRIRLRFIKNPKIALLADTSGTMIGSPIIKLRELIAGFNNFRRFVFDTTCRELDPSQEVGEAGGFTDMAAAFRLLKSEGIQHTVMITDGQPNSEKDALREAIGLKIDVLYVGPEPAPEFLEKLANMTGGNYRASSLHDVLKLDTQIRGLLPEPSKPIAL